jgi:uncharacterized protein YigE (DUF2233 family)
LRLLLYAFLLVQGRASYVIYITDPQNITFHYMQNGKRIGTLEELAKTDTTIDFAMNGCMFRNPGYLPVGLYVEKGKALGKMKILNNSKVNFGISQVVFYIDRVGKAGIVEAKRAKISDYYYAVQIAPMLLMNGQINPRIRDMKSKYIRNGIGIRSDNRIVFLISIDAVSMEQFANKFQSLGCVSAAYIDGAVSESWKKGDPHPQTPGQFGPFIAAH